MADTITITKRDRADALRLLAQLHIQVGYVIASNTPPSTEDEDRDLADAKKIQAEALDLAKRLRRAR